MKTIFSKDIENRRMNITREFAAPVEKTWKAWTNREWLDQWWAPKPWKAETKSMDFREGGSWLYAMVGPDGTRHWARADYKKINELKSFTVSDCFCDEKGVKNDSFPSMDWKVEFIPAGSSTKVQVEITAPTKEDLDKIIEMGFEQGFSAAHDNLDELLAKK